MQLVHFEHALPALAELGLEHLVPLFLGGDRAQVLDEATVRKVLGALSSASETRALRRLVVVSRSSAEQLLEMETDQAAKTRALREAALCTSDEAKEAVLGFFSQLGISLDVSPVSLTGLGPSQEPSQSGETTGEAPSGDS